MNSPLRYQRHDAFITPEQQTALHRARVLLAGCGAGSTVGDHLARLGIGRDGGVILADPDVVTLDNLNRQSYDERDLDTNKAVALAARLHCINSEVNIQAVVDGPLCQP